MKKGIIFFLMGMVCCAAVSVTSTAVDFALPIPPAKVKPATSRKIWPAILCGTRVYKKVICLDVSASSGEQVGAIGAGQVVKSSYAENGYGYHVVVQHNDSMTSTYAHLSELLVKEGQRVNKGQVLGLVGSTGLSSTPHLGLFMRVHGELVHPCGFLPCELLP